MHHLTLTRALLITACALPVLAAGCKDDAPAKLFDDSGTWVLRLFRVEDGDEIGGFSAASRVDRFMIHYDQENEVVAAATCRDSMGNTNLTESLCDLSGPAGYQCRCFDYDFTSNMMIWTEFAPKGQTLPPEHKEEGVLQPGEPFGIAIEEYMSISNAYRYRPLPYGLFNSDGQSSEYVFEERSETLIDATGCKEICAER